MRRFKIVLSIAAALMLSSVCLADITTTFNSNLPAPGVYFGTGNLNGHFATTTADYGSTSHYGPVNISVSLRGAVAYGSAITPTNDAEYDCTGANCSFQWSVYTNAILNEFTYTLLIDDLTSGTSLTFDPSGQTVYTPKLDDDYWVVGTGKVAHLTNGKNPYRGDASGFQNSEQFVFFNALGLNYSPTDKLLVTLSASSYGNPSASVTIGFNTPAPVPEPSAIFLTLTVLGFLGFRRLRRHEQA
jgi:hypothetical protein